MLRVRIIGALLSVAGISSLVPSAHAAESQAVKLCAFPLSPTKALDVEVAKAVFDKIPLRYEMVDLAKDLGKRPTSKYAIANLLNSKCDVFAGIPTSKEDMQFKNGMAISSPYLSVKFVKFTYPEAKITQGGRGVVAVAYETPGQLIAAEDGDRDSVDVENTTGDVIDAVVSGKAEYGIAWYPSLLEYEMGHRGIRFMTQKTETKVSNWNLSFVANSREAGLISKISGALRQLSSDVAFQGIVKPWQLKPTSAAVSSPARSSIQSAVYTYPAGYAQSGYRLIDVSDNGKSDAHQARFAQTQIVPGSKLYATECAQCHGDKLQGHTAPALRGPGFAPAKGSTFTIGGIYQYMTTNMPADKPGKLKPKQYANIMAYLLHENGYSPDGKELDPKTAEDNQEALNSFVQ